MEINEIRMLAENTFDELMDEFWDNAWDVAYDNNLWDLDRWVFFDEIKDLFYN